MGYYIDLSTITIEQYQENLASADLIPSRMVLKENIQRNFAAIKTMGIGSVDELFQLINSKEKIHAFAVQSKIDENYITVLAREIKGYRQKPNRIKDFPALAKGIVEKLEEIGIKNTLQLYDKILTPISRGQLSKQLDIDEHEVLKLAKLTDLSRIKWVNHTFAYVLHEAGYDTAKKVADANYEELYETVKQLNEERQLYKGHIGLRDMKRCIEEAKGIQLEIEY